MVQTHVLNYSILKTVGEISVNKINKLSEKGFTVQNFVNGQFAQLIINRTNDMLIVAQNQITYVPAPTNIDTLFSNPENIVEILANVLDILLLDGNANADISLERSYPSESNTFLRSLSLLREDFVSSIGSQSIAYRIPFVREIIQGELRLEPFFADASRYFLGCKMATKQPFPIHDMSRIWHDMIRLITEEFEPLAKRLFDRES